MNSAGRDRATGKARLRWALGLTVGMLVVETAGGYWSGSLALFADAAHMFTDVGALLLAYAAMTLAERAASKEYTFGLYRAEILAAFVNAQLLLVVCGLLLFQSYVRFREPAEVETGLMGAVAFLGLLANVAAVFLLHGHRRASLNVRAAYLEVLTDTASSFAVLAGAVAIGWTGIHWIDPLLSACIATAILPRAFSILRQAGHVLLEGTPRDVNLARLRDELLSIPGVDDLHDLHLWTLTSGFHSASVHVLASPGSEPEKVLRDVRRVLEEQTGVEHATVQVEQPGDETCRATARHR
ncbi:MAG: cation efflux system protein [Candidatus Binatia bacterium]|nr:MAG: cation efflux system protein [Candidatus Binatia bacterium]